MDTCVFYAGEGGVVGQCWVTGTLQKTSGLVPAESPMPPQLYASAHCGILGTTPGNSFTGPVGGMQPVAFSPLASEHSGLYLGNSYVGAHILLVARIRQHKHIPVWPMFPLGCSRGFQHPHLQVLLGY